MRYTVLPADDGHDMRSNWMVHKAGNMESAHTKKSAAKRKARKLASPGDTLQIRRTDGTIQKTVTVQRGRSGQRDSGEQQSGGGIPGIGAFETGITDAFE